MFRHISLLLNQIVNWEVWFWVDPLTSFLCSSDHAWVIVAMWQDMQWVMCMQQSVSGWCVSKWRSVFGSLVYLWRQSWIVKKKETARGLKASIAGMLAALHGFKAARSCLETCTMLRNDTENCSLHCRMRHWFHCLAPSQQWVNGEHYSTITLNRRRMMQMVSSRVESGGWMTLEKFYKIC